MSRPLRWPSGVLIGLGGAVTGVAVLLAVGLLSGRGASLITAAGANLLPQALASAVGLSPPAAYLIVHAAFYIGAGLVAVILARVADRSPGVMTGVVFLGIMVELGFLVWSTQTAARYRMGAFTWWAFLAAHGAADLVFVLLLLRAHPTLLRSLRQGYEM